MMYFETKGQISLLLVILLVPVATAAQDESSYFMPKAEYGSRARCPANSRVLTAKERSQHIGKMCTCLVGYKKTATNQCANRRTGKVENSEFGVRCPPNSSLASNGRTCNCREGYRMSRIQNVCMKRSSLQRGNARDADRGTSYKPKDNADELRRKRFKGNDQQWAAYEASRLRRLAKKQARVNPIERYLQNRRTQRLWERLNRSRTR